MDAKAKIGITADSSSAIEYAPFKNNIKITRTYINFGNQHLLDGEDIKAQAFYKMLEKTDVIPTTSAPTTGEILKRLDEWNENGATDVIHFAISSGLSKYGLHIKSIIDETKEVNTNFYVFDSGTACLSEGYNAKYAEVLAEKGYSVKDILTECEHFRLNTMTYFMVGDLKYLVKNGRLSATGGAIAGLMKIKPILKLGLDGLIVPFKKVRTNKKAMDKLFDITVEQGHGHKRCVYCVHHSDRLDDAIILRNRIKETVHNAVRIDLTDVTPTIGAHIGPHLLGTTIIVLDDLKENFELEDKCDYPYKGM
ncbi:MAG: DegV family protein [Bacilli bacterium]